MLDLWERGFGLSPVERGLLLLKAAFPDQPREALAALPLGERDARLAALSCRMFGSRAEALAECPACGERLEVPLDLPGLYRDPPGAGAGEIDAHGRRIRFRVPDSADLLAVAGMEPDAARDALLARCTGSSDSFPEPVRGALEQAMEEADPRANVILSLHCPACGHAWRELFDLVDFLWREMEGWARRILAEVHTLARAYGWSERDILAMSPWRRRFYMEFAVS